MGIYGLKSRVFWIQERGRSRRISWALRNEHPKSARGQRVLKEDGIMLKAMQSNMNRRAMGIALAIVALAGIAPVAHGEATTLKVEISTEHATIKNTEQLSVDTKIRNTGNEAQDIQVWSCSYPDNWTSDNLAVSIEQVPCKKNDLIRVRLNPGETYERDLSVQIAVAAEEIQDETVTFRLGFKSPMRGSGSAPDVVTQDEQIWSNPITVKVL